MFSYCNSFFRRHIHYIRHFAVDRSILCLLCVISNSEMNCSTAADDDVHEDEQAAAVADGSANDENELMTTSAGKLQVLYILYI